MSAWVLAADAQEQARELGRRLARVPVGPGDEEPCTTLVDALAAPARPLSWLRCVDLRRTAATVEPVTYGGTYFLPTLAPDLEREIVTLEGRETSPGGSPNIDRWTTRVKRYRVGTGTAHAGLHRARRRAAQALGDGAGQSAERLRRRRPGRASLGRSGTRSPDRSNPDRFPALDAGRWTRSSPRPGASAGCCWSTGGGRRCGSRDTRSASQARALTAHS